jgi:hypothetical protein
MLVYAVNRTVVIAVQSLEPNPLSYIDMMYRSAFNSSDLVPTDKKDPDLDVYLKIELPKRFMGQAPGYDFELVPLLVQLRRKFFLFVRMSDDASLMDLAGDCLLTV